ncbi:unnamed protein product [Arctogadus glacialis]
MNTGLRWRGTSTHTLAHTNTHTHTHTHTRENTHMYVHTSTLTHTHTHTHTHTRLVAKDSCLLHHHLVSLDGCVPFVVIKRWAGGLRGEESLLQPEMSPPPPTGRRPSGSGPLGQRRNTVLVCGLIS